MLEKLIRSVCEMFGACRSRVCRILAVSTLVLSKGGGNIAVGDSSVDWRTSPRPQVVLYVINGIWWGLIWFCVTEDLGLSLQGPGCWSLAIRSPPGVSESVAFSLTSPNGETMGKVSMFCIFSLVKH